MIVFASAPERRWEIVERCLLAAFISTPSNPAFMPEEILGRIFLQYLQFPTSLTYEADPYGNPMVHLTLHNTIPQGDLRKGVGHRKKEVMPGSIAPKWLENGAIVSA